MANWGGARPNSGPKPGSTYARLRRFRKAEAHEILTPAEERKLWKRHLHSKDERVALQALMFVVTQRDGRAYQQINPLQAQRLAAGADPKIAEVLQNLLHQPGTEVTLTEKKARITSGTQALENINAEGKAKLLTSPPKAPSDMPVTLDASATSRLDPSSRKTGVGHFGAETHTERNQDSGKSLETKGNG